MNFKKLQNSYYVMRHGQSTANIKHLVISDPKNGVPHYGLTTFGKQQVKDSIKANKELDKDTIIYSSDFKRARESAEIVRAHLKAKPIVLSKHIRERYLKKLEKKKDNTYHLLWEEDIKGKTLDTAEPVTSVADRITELISETEKKYKGKKILLVTHGDIASIFLTLTKGKDPKYHHQLFSLLKNAELRKAN